MRFNRDYIILSGNNIRHGLFDMFQNYDEFARYEWYY